MSWDIKGKDNAVKATVDKIEYNGEWMGEVYVTVTVESPAPIAFTIGDYIMYRGERFEINYDPGKIKYAEPYKKGDAFKYENIKFNSLTDELTRCDFLDIVLNDNNLHFTGLPKFTFYGGVQDLANRIQANLNRAYPNQWTVSVSPEYSGNKELNVSVDNQKVWDALSILVNDFETYFTIKGRTITIGAAGVPAGHLFKYGKGNGLYEIEQTAETDQAIVTRLRAYGSTRNLPHRYYNSLTGADGQKLIPDNMAVQNLMLPSFPYTTQDPYIDSANKAALGMREGTIFFDGSQEDLEEIYPSIEGMTAEQLKSAGVPCNSTGALDVLVSAEQMTDNGVGEINKNSTETKANPATFRVTLKDLGFDINDHLTTETAAISFKSGMLGRREFEIAECKKVGNNYELELKRVYDEDIKLWFPYKNYNAKAGDKFVLLHIEMPDVYIKAAAQRLLTAATAWLAKNDYSRSVYAPKVDEIFMARQHDEAMASNGTITSLHDTLCPGMMMLFEDEDLNIDASIFIDRLTIKEGESSIPTYEVALKEEKTVGRLDKMQNQIDSLASGKGDGGYSASQIRGLMTTYGDKRYARKELDVTDSIDAKWQSTGYNADALGTGWQLGLDDDGLSSLTVDRLYVRYKAIFDALEIRRLSQVGGVLVLSPAGGTITSVEEAQVYLNTLTLKDADGKALKDADGKTLTVLDESSLTGVWRCRLRTTDGERQITNDFAVGDFVQCRTFNLATGQRFYWRRCLGVGADYIDLSMTDCATGSDTPLAADEIATFGNALDASRQNAISIAAYGDGTPSITLYQGISTYSTTGCDKTRISADGSKFTGDFVVQSEGAEVPLAQFLSDRISLSVTGQQQRLVTDDRTATDIDNAGSDEEGTGIDFRSAEFAALPAGTRIALEIDTTSQEQDLVIVELSEEYGFTPFAEQVYPLPTMRFETTLEKRPGQNAFDNGEDPARTLFNLYIALPPEQVTGWRIYTLPLAGGLKNTGIDIERGKITLKGDTEIITNDGKSAALFRDGKIKAEYVEAENVSATRLETIPESATAKARTVIEHGKQIYYDDSGVPRLLVHSGQITDGNSGSGESVGAAVDEVFAAPTRAAEVTLLTYTPTALSEIDLSALTLIISGTLAVGGTPLPDYGNGPYYGNVEVVIYDGERTIAQRTVAITAPGALTLSLSGFGKAVLDSGTSHVISAEVRVNSAMVFSSSWRLQAPVVALPVGHFDTATEIAANGAVLRSGANYARVLPDETTLRCGEYMLRVCADGIQVSKDAGASWEILWS